MAIKNVVFDMGMVLLNWDPYIPCLRHTQDHALAAKINQATFLHDEWGTLVDTGAMTDIEYARTRVLPRLDTAAERALLLDIMEDYYLDALYPVRPVEALTGELLDKGYRVCMLSNAGYRMREYLYKIKNSERFSAIVISAEVGLMKPDYRIYRRLEEEAHISPEETLFVDDRPENIQGAEKLGWSGYLFDTQDVAGLRARIGLK